MSKYNIVFLDFDGVLNNEPTLIQRSKLNYDLELDYISNVPIKSTSDSYSLFFNEVCWTNLSAIIKCFNQIPNLKIVLSTSWRNMKTLEEWNYQFSLIEGWNFDIIDKTPQYLNCNEMVEIIGGFKSTNCRGKEIQFWLDNNKDMVDNYCILDDECDMLIEQQYNFVQTDLNFGFTESDIEKVLKIFNKEVILND